MNYNIEGTELKLKEVFTVKDWDASKRTDELFNRIKAGGKDPSLLDLSKEEFKQLLKDVLLTNEGKEVPDELINRIPLATGLKIFTDFFLVYLESNLDMSNISNDFAEKVKELVQK